MDKELLRIVIISIGVAVIIVMVLWSLFKSKYHEFNFYDRGNPLDNIDDSLIMNTDDDFDIVPLGSAVDEEDIKPDPITIASDKAKKQAATSSSSPAKPKHKSKAKPKPVVKESKKSDLPKIIQFSIVSRSDEGFNGEKLVSAFQLVGLEYGSMKIYQRLNGQRQVDFAVASMVEPGTFPETELDSFNSPGLVFFLQLSEIEEPLLVFEDFIQTINLLANELAGEKWDHNRQPLTDETIDAFRLQIA
ncbi:MAG: cell division protein ZipA C-terminal FtsZ-binding domain-containing protein [Methylococcales bacterium]|nr:cell division protein ZipA C-terminal FtsZ-binding domain-containing protein [Methylococcales bacterium]